ncbi:ABC transporter permease [Desulfopila aestuarii]|uniref:Thiamine transport system permease protein n=1 Tax=Desulfopila aestuarii DSM 18488 TaxID=1121416 RepID=A0A1M7Y3G3_9BACT|nr:iron ABC transporter permease [Desulfopila aestuarii]SHO46734.1 thiamine transport system permease protein [Desulfopila aestuarii DSM 18488]
MNGSTDERAGRLRPPKILHWALLVLPLLFLVLFYFYPLAKIVTLSFLPDGSWQPDQLRRIFHSPVFGRIIWFTTWQATLSTLLTLAVALPGAYVFARFTFPGKNLLQALTTVPFVLPTVVTAAAFRALLGNNGLVNSWLMTILDLTTPPIKLDQTVSFFLLAHVFYNYALVLRIVGGYWAGLDRSLSAAARMLGASPWQTFQRITFPLLLPAIGSAALLVFIFCFTSFGVVLILGGPSYATIEVEIYRQAVQLFNLPMAAVLSLIQIGINFLLMYFYARLDRKTKSGFYSDTAMGEAIQPGTGSQKLLVGSNVAFMLLLMVIPLLALVIRSFVGEDGLTLAFYNALFTSQAKSVFFVEPISAVKNSVGFGLAAMVLAVILGLLAATFIASGDSRQRSLWDALIMLPLATSAVTLGFGYIITLNRPPLNLRDSLALVPIAHALVAFPFVIRCILPSIRQIPHTLREAASLLGASPLVVWRKIDLPLITRAILVGAVFAFSISMGEFGASAFVTRPHTPTMPVAIFRFLGQPGEMNYGQAMAMSTILMLVTCSGFWLLGRLDSYRKGALH